MKKIYLTLFVSLALLFLIFGMANAKLCDSRPLDAHGKPMGLVPCGDKDSSGKQCSCDIGHIFVMLSLIYNFIVIDIATPLAVLALTIGGILWLISAGNPRLLGVGKSIFWAAVIGLALVFCSWIIIDFILKAVGYTGNWSSI